MAALQHLIMHLLLFGSLSAMASFPAPPDLKKACAGKQAGDSCDYGYGTGTCQMVQQKLMCLPQQGGPNPPGPNPPGPTPPNPFPPGR